MTEEMVWADVKIVLSGIEIETRLPISREPISTGAFLPVARAFCDAITEASDGIAAEIGERISCAKGCCECCYQFVPIACSEAHALQQLVDGLAEPMRSGIRERFQAAVRRLRAAGFLDRLDMTRERSDEENESDSSWYRSLRIPCPLLEDGCCLMYEHRPLVCREYLVCSDPAFCRSPTRETIRPAPLAAHASRALMHLEDADGSGSLHWVPLTCALDWARENPEPPPRPGTLVLNRFLEFLGKR